MKEFDESNINRDTVDVHFWWGRTYEEFRERCKKTVPLPAHATYFSDVVDATLSYQKGKDKVKYFVVTYPYSENERNTYLKSDQMGTLHQIPKWKMRFKSYDTFLKDCIDIMKKDFRTHHEENTFDASKNPVDNPIYLKGGIPMYQFNRDAIDTTSFSEKHYQTLRDFITSDKPLANDGESYGSLEYNDGRHQISCNISAVPAFNEDGSKLDKKEVELVMNIDGEEHDIVETLSAEKLASENYQDLMDFCTYVMEQEVVEREQKKESVQAKDETVTKNFNNFNEEDFDKLYDMVMYGEEGAVEEFSYKETKYLLESAPSLEHPEEMDVHLIPNNPDISITVISSNQFKVCDYKEFMSLVESIAESHHNALNTSHHVAYHIDPVDSVKSNTGEKIADAVAKSLMDKGWSVTLPGNNSPEHDAMYFSATKNGSYLEFKRDVMPAATVAGKAFVLEGTLRNILSRNMIETLKNIGKEKEFLPIPKHMEKVSVFSDQMRINYYKDAVQEKIQDVVKNGATAKDVERQVLQAIKKDAYYRPDQYTGTTKENQSLLGIVHQEVEGMKRNGLLKENSQTGTLSVSKARDQEVSR